MTDLREQLQQALGDTYTLERELPRPPGAIKLEAESDPYRVRAPLTSLL